MNKNERILSERDAKLAKPIRDDSAIEKVEYISFSLGDDSEYGIIYKDVEGVIRPETISKVPMVAGSISGVINWRGNLLAVINLNHFLSKKDDSPGESPWVIVVRSDASPVGLAVNNVGTNRFYLKDELASRHQGVAKSIRYIQGIVAKKVAIIDVEALLMDVQL